MVSGVVALQVCILVIFPAIVIEYSMDAEIFRLLFKYLKTALRFAGGTIAVTAGTTFGIMLLSGLSRQTDASRCHRRAAAAYSACWWLVAGVGSGSLWTICFVSDMLPTKPLLVGVATGCILVGVVLQVSWYLLTTASLVTHPR